MIRYKRPLLLSLTTAVTVLALLYLAGRGLTSSPYIQMESSRPPDAAVPLGELVPEQSVVQSFTARRDGLSRIDVKVGTYARVNTGTLTLHLREHPDGPDIRSLAVDVSKLRDNAYLPFTFEPIWDSADRQYYLVLTSSGSREGNAVTVWASRCDCLSDGSLLRGQPAPSAEPVQDLLLVTYFTAEGVQGRLAVLAERVNAFKPAWLGWPVLVVLAVLAGLSFTALWYTGLSVLTEDLTFGEACALCSLNVALVGTVVFVW